MDDKERELLERLTGQAMQALICAAWSNPGPSNHAFEAWKNDLPPDAGDRSHSRWIAERSVEYASSTADVVRAAAALGKEQSQ
jgi:hypothetical protein